MAGVEEEGKGKNERAKRVSVREGDSPPKTPALLLTLSLHFDGLPRRLAKRKIILMRKTDMLKR